MHNRIIGGYLVVLGVVSGLVDWFFPRLLCVILGPVILGLEAIDLTPKNVFKIYWGVMCFSVALVAGGVYLLRKRR